MYQYKLGLMLNKYLVPNFYKIAKILQDQI